MVNRDRSDKYSSSLQIGLMDLQKMEIARPSFQLAKIHNLSPSFSFLFPRLRGNLLSVDRKVTFFLFFNYVF
jgi:hypothetical protein